MAHQNVQDPLHGVTLEMILKRMVDQVGWKKMAEHLPVRCFLFDPTITSSLRFFRKTPWAREKLEQMYVKVFKKRYCPKPPKSELPRP